MADGIRPAKRPQPGGFDLSTFAPSLDAEAGESLGAFLEEFKPTEPSDEQILADLGCGGSESALAILLGRMRLLGQDHGPDDWPAVQMRDITALCDAAMRRHTNAELNRLRALLAQAESSLDAIENLCALNPRLADGEIHYTAMLASRQLGRNPNDSYLT